MSAIRVRKRPLLLCSIASVVCASAVRRRKLGGIQRESCSHRHKITCASYDTLSTRSISLSKVGLKGPFRRSQTFSLFTGTADPGESKDRVEAEAYWRRRLGSPYFANGTRSRVTATLGTTTYLHCIVGNVGDRQVRRKMKGILAQDEK